MTTGRSQSRSINNAGKWQFDTKEGLDEILRRRVGRNELSTIQVASLTFKRRTNMPRLIRQDLATVSMRRRIVSHPGKKDGLYWPTAAGETPSPLGDLAAEASAEGYKAGAKPIPYHGYYYRILKRQGAGAPGGAYDYLVKGKMKGGFALIAYAAGIRQFRYHDLHGQSRRDRVSEGSRAEHDEGRSQDRRLRTRSGLDQSRLVPTRQTGSNIALGHLGKVRFGSKADSIAANANVRLVPIADINHHLFSAVVIAFIKLDQFGEPV